MLLKKYRIVLDRTFIRKSFSDGEDMCSKCCLNWPDNCNKEDFDICEKANFDNLLFSPDYEHAYVILKKKKDRKD